MYVSYYYCCFYLLGVLFPHDQQATFSLEQRQCKNPVPFKSKNSAGTFNRKKKKKKQTHKTEEVHPKSQTRIFIFF